MNIEEKVSKIRAVVGKPIPLGATVNKTGINFCVQTDRIGKLELIIYKKGTREILKKIPFSDDMRYGRVYAMHVTNFDIKRFDYSYELNGIEYDDLYAKIVNKSKTFGDKEQNRTYSVYNDDYDWEDDVKPRYDFADMIMYRLHTRGFTMHKSSKVKNKGTYKGITEKLEHFKALGITTIELMPAYDFEEIYVAKPENIEDIKNGAVAYAKGYNSMATLSYGNSINGAFNPAAYISHGNQNHFANNPSYSTSYNASYNANRSNPTGSKMNFFGYSKGHYFAPKSSFSIKGGANAVTEFKDMVKLLHKNGIEVIMEFYFTKDTNPQLAIDCIRYWVMEYHIDGVKVNLDVANVDMLKSDPILWDTKIIGDRWDIISSAEKYNPVFGEKRHIGVCHDGFMVTAKRFIKSDEGQVYEMISRIKDNNEVGAIINYLGNHNTFTLLDSVSYERKHNEANGENNCDGNDYNYSWNCGVEGTTKKQKVVSLRKKQIKNALALLFLSQGTPMIFSGDEMGCTRNGNNNPYCQDNELSYIDWNVKKLGSDILTYVKEMIEYRKSHKILHMEKEMQMTDYKSIGCPDLSLHGVLPWRVDYNHVNRNFAMLYNEKYTGKDGGLIYIACNMYWESQEFNIPMAERISDWKIDIVTEDINVDKDKLITNRTLNVPPRSIVVLSLDRSIK